MGSDPPHRSVCEPALYLLPPGAVGPGGVGLGAYSRVVLKVHVMCAVGRDHPRQSPEKQDSPGLQGHCMACIITAGLLQGDI